MFDTLVKKAEYLVWASGIPVGDEVIPFLAIALLGSGIFLTFRLAFIQLRRFGHGVKVTSGVYDDPNDPGDVSHFQALTTALSATVGIGNIAGVAIAIHWGGPGALFWMWITAFFGMATKYSEVTLAQRFREIETDPDRAYHGVAAGGPMYYIEKGLGWKPMAVFVAGALVVVSMLGSNSVQANTVADNLATGFGIPKWVSGIFTATVLALVIVGGIRRIGRVTAILAPVMAVIYTATALVILALQYDQVLPALALIVQEAFSPSAGVAGAGVGTVLTTMMWGVRRGLFSNEAGQGSAPIAHAAAQTDEPVSEGVVALLEPFIDTLVICTMTGLVIIATGVWKESVPTVLDLAQGDVAYVAERPDGRIVRVDTPEEIPVVDGRQPATGTRFAWHEVAVERLFVDPERQRPFSGTLLPREGQARGEDGTVYAELHGLAVESGAPLSQMAFERGLSPIMGGGGIVVLVSVLLFGLSTSISWSYYGDRCLFYLFGPKAIRPYRLVYVAVHFLGAVATLATVWTLSDIGLGLATVPNLLAVLLLSPLVARLTRDYFERRPWLGKKKVDPLNAA